MEIYTIDDLTPCDKKKINDPIVISANPDIVPAKILERKKLEKINGKSANLNDDKSANPNDNIINNNIIPINNNEIANPIIYYMNLHTEGFAYFISGDWESSMILLEEYHCLTKDKATYLILKYMEKYDNIAPVDWDGCRRE